jgi:uncharacterized protein YecT (DUF1311 family)
MVVVVAGDRFRKITEGLGITKNQAVLLASGAGDPLAPLDGKPSFDCSKATSASARLICGDPDLSKADRLLGTKFRAAADTNQAARSQIIEQQVRWIRARNSRCGVGPDKANTALEQLLASKPCVLEAINARIAELEAEPISQPKKFLQTGEYIHAGTPCEQGSMATRLNFDGRKFTGSRTYCVEVDGQPAGSAVRVKPCTDASGREAVFTIKSSTEFSTPGGGPYRFCGSGSAPTIAASPGQQPQTAAPVSARAGIGAALRRAINEKVKLRRGLAHEGYALQSWTDPVADVGGQTLLKYDSTKSEWIILDTDGGGLDVKRIISKGVPEKLAAELVSRFEGGPAAAAPSTLNSAGNFASNPKLDDLRRSNSRAVYDAALGQIQQYYRTTGTKLITDAVNRRGPIITNTTQGRCTTTDKAHNYAYNGYTSVSTLQVKACQGGENTALNVSFDPPFLLAIHIIDGENAYCKMMCKPATNSCSIQDQSVSVLNFPDDKAGTVCGAVQAAELASWEIAKSLQQAANSVTDNIAATVARISSETRKELESEEGRAFVLPLLNAYRVRGDCQQYFEYVGGKIVGRSIEGKVGVVLVEISAVAKYNTSTTQIGSPIANTCGRPSQPLGPGGVMRMEVKGQFRQYDTGWRLEGVI